MRFILSIVGATVLLAGPAFALEIQPGLWQDAETAEINGKVYPPEIMTDCVSPEDAKDIVKAAQAQMKASIMDDQPQGCGKLDIKQNGNVMVVEMKCDDPKQGAIDVSMSMTVTVNSPQSMTRVKKSTMRVGGQTMAVSATTESKWLSASCDKK
ncbi:MAG TPA: DUF3617 family protein [Pseudolabrys sp.]|nr:DUF3617 family protein [Pseudolabrys sp.]